MPVCLLSCLAQLPATDGIQFHHRSDGVQEFWSEGDATAMALDKVTINIWTPWQHGLSPLPADELTVKSNSRRGTVSLSFNRFARGPDRSLPVVLHTSSFAGERLRERFLFASLFLSGFRIS